MTELCDETKSGTATISVTPRAASASPQSGCWHAWPCRTRLRLAGPCRCATRARGHCRSTAGCRRARGAVCPAVPARKLRTSTRPAAGANSRRRTTRNRIEQTQLCASVFMRTPSFTSCRTSSGRQNGWCDRFRAGRSAPACPPATAIQCLGSWLSVRLSTRAEHLDAPGNPFGGVCVPQREAWRAYTRIGAAA